MYRIYIMFTCYCTAGYECTEYILCLLVIVPQFINVQNIYYGTCYCTAVYECTEYIFFLLVIVLQDMNVRNKRLGSTLDADEVQFTQVNIR